MKRITLTIKEFYLFKELADFFYDVTISRDRVIINAEAKMLEGLGY
jgi:hypothetical protein